MSSGPATAYIDGASSGNPGPSGIGAVLRNADGATLAELSRPIGLTTNNVAEYLALIYVLIEARRQEVRLLEVRTDSELLARQISGAYKVRDGTLRMFYDLARELMRGFESVRVSHVPREQNADADRLARRGSKTLTGADAGA